jgi:hypothetical protein
MRLAKDLNLGQLMALQMIGSMPKQLVMKNTEMFAKEVMPQLKQMWSPKWQDRWCPRPMSERAIPGKAEAK